MSDQWPLMACETNQLELLFFRYQIVAMDSVLSNYVEDITAREPWQKKRLPKENPLAAHNV